jgi:hypothetical protein
VGVLPRARGWSLRVLGIGVALVGSGPKSLTDARLTIETLAKWASARDDPSNPNAFRGIAPYFNNDKSHCITHVGIPVSLECR